MQRRGGGSVRRCGLWGRCSSRDRGKWQGSAKSDQPNRKLCATPPSYRPDFPCNGKRNERETRTPTNPSLPFPFQTGVLVWGFFSTRIRKYHALLLTRLSVSLGGGFVLVLLMSVGYASWSLKLRVETRCGRERWNYRMCAL